jgi:uncharacterized protein YcnI
MPSMRPFRARRFAVVALTAVASLAAAAPAFGHAVVSPPVVESGTLQVFTLSVPTEREDRATTSIELTVPKGFAIDSFAPARGWKRKVSATGSGETAIVNTVTWTGGSVPTEEDAVFQFNASANSAQTYTFKVRQTYDDDAVVDWSGAQDSDTPAPKIEAKASLGGGGSSTIAIVALLAGTLGIVLGLLAILSSRGARPVT